MTRFIVATATAACMALAMSSAGAAVTFYLSKASLDLVAATTLVEDFESPALVKDTPLASFSHNGITFTGAAGTPFPNVWVASPGYLNFDPINVATTSSILTANGDEDITAAFAATSAVGFDIYFNRRGPSSVRVFNGATLLDTINFAGNIGGKGYLGIVSSVPITSFRWLSTEGGIVNTGIDNISMAAAVPEPAVLSLMAVGLLCAAAAGLRRRKL